MLLISTIKQAWNYATEVFAEDSKKYRRAQQWKSLWLTLHHPIIASRWFDILNSEEFSQISKYRKRLFLKPFRAYISINWNQERKIKVIRDTFRFILSKNKNFQQVIKEDIELCRFPLNETMDVSLTLGYDERYRKEGELVLSVNCDQLGGNIVSASFSFEEIEQGKWVCYVACVQGHEVKDVNYSKLIQKKLFGLRPKSLAVLAIQELCHNLGISELYGTSDGIQAYRKKHAIHLQRYHAIHFRYDDFWIESGGKKVADGWFQLPIIAVRRIISEIKFNKRSQYTQRYAMLDSMSKVMKNSIEKLMESSE